MSRGRSIRSMPLGRRNEKRLPLPFSLCMSMLHTEKRGAVLRYFSMMPLQFMSPNPPLLFLAICRSSAPMDAVSYTFAPRIFCISSCVRPAPVSVTDISMYSSDSFADSSTVPPAGVNLPAFSVRVFIMKRVRALSAFTTAVVSLIFRFMPLIANSWVLLAIMSKSSFMEKFSMLRSCLP